MTVVEFPRRFPLLSASEQRAEAVLDEVAERRGSRVRASVKLSQVIRRRPTGISDEQWRYATRAHFDFVVCNRETTVPEFAVELDDPTHDSADGQRRDRMKDAVCEAANFELLRITSRELARGSHGWRILEYLIEARDFTEAYYRAQDQGYAPPDGIADFPSAFDIGRGCSNDLAGPARAQAQRMQRAGSVEGYGIQSFWISWKNGWTEAWAWLHIRDDLYILEKVRLRSHRFYCGVGQGNLAEDLAAAAVGDQLPRLGTPDDPFLVRQAHLARQLARLHQQRDEMEWWLGLKDVQL
jgi:Protein of unknown function (DUF2726)